MNFQMDGNFSERRTVESTCKIHHRGGGRVCGLRDNVMSIHLRTIRSITNADPLNIKRLPDNKPKCY